MSENLNLKLKIQNNIHPHSYWCNDNNINELKRTPFVRLSIAARLAQSPERRVKPKKKLGGTDEVRQYA